jgi:hypothetical protein
MMSPYTICLATALTLSIAFSSALAQTPLTFKIACVSVSRAPEPLGDREAHSLQIAESTCRVEGGPLEGAVGAGSGIYEWNGPNGVGLAAGQGVYRKSGVHAAWLNTEHKLALIMVDGKPVGATFNGRGRFLIATGSAAVLSGKTYSFAGKTTAPGQFVLDLTME